MVQFYQPKRAAGQSQPLILKIDDLDAFGQGVASYQGKTIFVTGALPGETAEVVITEQKRQFSRAKLRRRLSGAAQRVTPRCAHFAECGGCQQQHASLALQQSSKARALSRLLQHTVDEIISGSAWGYRRRTRLSLLPARAGKPLQMGFRKAASAELVDVHQCPVLEPALEALLAPLRQCLASLATAQQVGHVELVLADNGVVMVLRHLCPLPASDRQRLLDFSRQQAVSVFLAITAENGGQDDNTALSLSPSVPLEQLSGATPCYHVAGLSLAFSPRDFIQVNSKVNEQMVARALQWLEVSSQDRVLDLFCGMGNFTLPLATLAAEVVGVEGVAALVATASANAKALGLANALFVHQDLQTDPPPQAKWAQQRFTKLLLDPSRAGASGILPLVLRIQPQRLVYVSCHPATLARDKQVLCAGGYQLSRLAMLDMFPHTGHAEAMALFTHKSAK